MIFCFLLSFCMTLCIFVPSILSPMVLGIIIMMLTLITSLIIGFSISYWFGYILFLVYVGGMLVMFCYVCAITPSPFLSYKTFWSLVFMLSIIFFFVFYFFLYFISTNYLMNMKLFPLSFNMLVSMENSFMIMMLAFILLFALFSAVKVCFQTFSPLRKLN